MSTSSHNNPIQYYHSKLIGTESKHYDINLSARLLMMRDKTPFNTKYTLLSARSHKMDMQELENELQRRYKDKNALKELQAMLKNYIGENDVRNMLYKFSEYMVESQNTEDGMRMRRIYSLKVIEGLLYNFFLENKYIVDGFTKQQLMDFIRSLKNNTILEMLVEILMRGYKVFTFAQDFVSQEDYEMYILFEKKHMIEKMRQVLYYIFLDIPEEIQPRLKITPRQPTIETNTETKQEETSSNNTTKECPYCGENISIKAKKCRYCNDIVDAEEENTSENKEYTIDNVIKVHINEEEAQLKIYNENNEIIVKSSQGILQINQQEIDISDIEAINYYLDENDVYHFVFETKDEKLRFSFDFLNNKNAAMEIINFSKQFWEKHILEKAYQDIISKDTNKGFVHIGNLFISEKGITKDSSGFIFSFGDLDNSIPWNGLNDYFQSIKAEIHPNAGVEYKIMYNNELFATIPLSTSNSAIIPELFHKVYLYATKNQTNVLFPPSFGKNSHKKEVVHTERREINCPYCNEIISSRAKKCKHCGEFLDKNVSNNSESKISDPNRDMSFWACVGRGFTNIFNFSGRSTRKEYWSYIIIAALIIKGIERLIIYNIPKIRIPTRDSYLPYIYGEDVEKIMIVTLIFMIILLIFTLSIKVRRMRDVSNNKFIIGLPYIVLGLGFGIGFIGGLISDRETIQFGVVVEIIGWILISIIAFFPSKK